MHFKGIARTSTKLKISTCQKTSLKKWISDHRFGEIFTTCIFDKDLSLESYHSKIRRQFFKWGKDLNRHFTGRQMSGQ